MNQPTSASTSGPAAAATSSGTAPGCPVDPAPQPKPMGQCSKPADPPPAPVPPPVSVSCKPPECCPKDPGGSSSCLDPLIAQQQSLMAKADSAKAFKAELETLQGKIKAAKVDYTAAEYQRLLDLWKTEDKDIVELIGMVVCTAKCWRTQIECFVCPLLYDLRLDAERLTGDTWLYKDVYSLYDLQYWYQRDVAAKQATFDRIKSVLTAWEKPAGMIAQVLGDNAKLRKAIRDGLGAPDAGKLIYDLFMRLVPMHLLIAPPAISGTTTGVDRKYVDLCACDTGTPDDCCGPDTGVTSVLAQMLGPQPYLIDPGQYDGVMCCLVQMRYLPAKDVLAAALADKQTNDNLIASLKAGIVDKKKAFEASAKAKLVLPFECCKDGAGKTDCGSKPPPPPPPPSPPPPPEACPPPTPANLA